MKGRTNSDTTNYNNISNNIMGLPWWLSWYHTHTHTQKSACKSRDQGSIPGSGRFPGKGNSNSFQYSFLENTMDREVWRATVHGVAKKSDMT